MSTAWRYQKETEVAFYSTLKIKKYNNNIKTTRIKEVIGAPV